MYTLNASPNPVRIALPPTATTTSTAATSASPWALLLLLAAAAYTLLVRSRGHRTHRNQQSPKQPLPGPHPHPQSMPDRKMEENIAQFCGVTGASVKDAKKFLEKYKRVDVAVDAYYGDGGSASSAPSSPAPRQQQHGASTSKLNALFDKYKDADGDGAGEEIIGVDGTIKMCEDLEVDPEDVVLLAVAYELKSPRMGEWKRAGYVDGWKALGADNLASMKSALARLRTRLTSGSDAAYFRKVYNHTFDFAKSEGQRSIPMDTASAFWALLLPYATLGARVDESGDTVMDSPAAGEGWRPEYNDWWIEFMNEKGGKGVSKDTWVMFLDFIRTTDARFSNYDIDAAWPSTIDDFVEWAKGRV
ncbi:Defective in cullin neddylation protein [Mycena chlorophos]|uniref:Defective in cullin neddylation protein n=1 Tax=Mycena chlorophos TaxID=658473 RepID=A0A8H6TK93_MYCCL|nr:Defective in cullin neddylation protein [Mycena chlorophos]